MTSNFQALAPHGKRTIHLTVNDEPVVLLASPNETLLGALRNQLKLTGTKYGCGTGDCCACTVNLDGQAILSCLCLVAELDGSSVTTVEGLSDGSQLNPVQQSFADKGAVQCGFCTPGMIMTINALLDQSKNPTEQEIRQYLRGNLCRCTGYQKIIDATLDAVDRIKGAQETC